MLEDKMAVLVIGSLGELVKKLIETDFRVMASPLDKSLYIESLALKRILDEWPVLDESRVFLLTGAMRHSIAKYRLLEQELEDLLVNKNSNSTTLYQLIFDLFARRDEIKTELAELNKLSGGVGKAAAIPDDVDFVVAKVGE